MSVYKKCKRNRARVIDSKESADWVKEQSIPNWESIPRATAAAGWIGAPRLVRPFGLKDLFQSAREVPSQVQMFVDIPPCFAN